MASLNNKELDCYSRFLVANRSSSLPSERRNHIYKPPSRDFLHAGARTCARLAIEVYQHLHWIGG